MTRNLFTDLFTYYSGRYFIEWLHGAITDRDYQRIRLVGRMTNRLILLSLAFAVLLAVFRLGGI